MSADEKTGLDQFGDYHDVENYVDDTTDDDVFNGKPADIVGDVQHSCSSRASSDSDYREAFYRDSTIDFVEKHMVQIQWSEDMDSAPSERSVWLSELIEKIKKRWRDNTGSFTYAICVSFNLYKTISHS